MFQAYEADSVEMCWMVPDWAPAPAPSSCRGKGGMYVEKEEEKKKTSSTENANLLKIQKINKYKKTLIQENFYSQDARMHDRSSMLTWLWKKEWTAIFHSPAWNKRVSCTESKRCFDNQWRRINDHKNKSKRTEHKTSGGNCGKRPTETELHSHYWVVPVRDRTGNVHTWFDTTESDAGTICSWDPVKRPPRGADG